MIKLVAEAGAELCMLLVTNIELQHCINAAWDARQPNMTEEGVTKVKLTKQKPEELVNSKGDGETITEKKEDPDELSSQDFKKAAENAQVSMCWFTWCLTHFIHAFLLAVLQIIEKCYGVRQDKLGEVAQSAQQGVASLLGSIQETLVPKAEEKEDPEVKDFRWGTHRKQFNSFWWKWKWNKYQSKTNSCRSCNTSDLTIPNWALDVSVLAQRCCYAHQLSLLCLSWLQVHRNSQPQIKQKMHCCCADICHEQVSNAVTHKMTILHYHRRRQRDATLYE